MKRLTNIVLVSFLVIIPSLRTSAQSAGAATSDREAVLDTIAQINHINWVWNTIKNYNNVIVLEEEYNKISPGNLNLNRIPDVNALNRITQILDTLHSLRKDDRELHRWRQNFHESRSRQIRDFKTKAVKSAKDALLSKAKECCSGWNCNTAGMGAVIAVADTVFDMTHCCVSLYNDYDNLVYKFDREMSDKNFEFDTAKMDLLHKQNTAMLHDQWQLIRKYNLDDRLRVSDNDIHALLKCLKGENHENIFNRLLPLRERFSLFPEYWYYLSCSALETGHFNEGLEACDTFFKINRAIFRDDPMEGTVALNKAFMLDKTDANKPEIRRCLERAWKNNILRGDWQLDYLVAIMYKGVFNEQSKAEMILEHAIALIEQESNSPLQYGERIGLTLKEGLHNCRNALHELRGEELEPFDESSTSKTIGEFVSKIFNDNYGGGLLVLTGDGRFDSDFILFLPNSDIKEINSKFNLNVETRDVGLFTVSHHKRVLNETYRAVRGDNVALYTFQNCSGLAFDQKVFSCSNGDISIFFTDHIDGYSAIQYLPEKISVVAKQIIEKANMDINYVQHFSVWKIEKVVVKDATFTRQDTMRR